MNLLRHLLRVGEKYTNSRFMAGVLVSTWSRESEAKKGKQSF